ncbi:hypothetical protein AB1Y20_020777 [Prymnesium parvum]|uniref:Uncharacterized protein n=1 Tax=Prymnesium parvum TaxID=97485 RepID=A0AB34JVQ7_PRYPA
MGLLPTEAPAEEEEEPYSGTPVNVYGRDYSHRIVANSVRLLSAPMPKKQFPKPGDILSGVPPMPGEAAIDLSIDTEGRLTLEILT